MASHEEAIRKAKEEYETAKAQAKARYEKTKARHETEARKLDTRRKIIVGGAMIELSQRGDPEACAMLDGIIQRLSREQDKKAFEGLGSSKDDTTEEKSPYV